MSKHASAFECLSKHLVAETKAFNVGYLFGCRSDFGCFDTLFRSLSLKPVSTHLSVSPLVHFHFLLFLHAAPWVTVILSKPRRYWIGLQGEVLGNVSALIRGAKGNKYWHVILFFTLLYLFLPSPSLSFFFYCSQRKGICIARDENGFKWNIFQPPPSHPHPRYPFLSFSHMESFFSPLWEHCTLSTKANNY